jgi:hypothetical protein
MFSLWRGRKRSYRLRPRRPAGRKTTRSARASGALAGFAGSAVLQEAQPPQAPPARLDIERRSARATTAAQAATRSSTTACSSHGGIMAMIRGLTAECLQTLQTPSAAGCGGSAAPSATHHYVAATPRPLCLPQEPATPLPSRRLRYHWLVNTVGIMFDPGPGAR